MKEAWKGLKSAGYWLGPVLLAAIQKAWLVITSRVPFNADEAVVALMARHINQGQPTTFFYGQAYMGSLDALLIAAGFQIFGEQVWVIRLLQSLLYLGTVATTALLAKRILGTRLAGLLAGLIAALPPVNVVLYTTVSLGGYGEVLLLGNLLLLIGLRIDKKITSESARRPDKSFLLLTWGVIAGLGFWAFGLTLVYIVPIALVLFWRLHHEEGLAAAGKTSGWILLGFLIGAAPWWLYALRNGPVELLTELTGSAIADPAGVPLTLRPFYHFYNLVLLGSTVIIGMRPPWEIRWLMLPLIPVMMVFWIFVFIQAMQRMTAGRNTENGVYMINGLGFTLLAGFLLTSFGADPSGRYFVPLIIPMAIFGADFILRISENVLWRQLVLILLVIGFQVGGTLQSWCQYPPGLTTQFDRSGRVDHSSRDELIRFLLGNGINRGYTNYWVAYPLAFLSDGELIYIPRIPYHQDFRYTERDDRYPPYREIVQRSDQVAYITTNHPELNQVIRDGFEAMDISWREKQIGDYFVFYDLSAVIRPRDIGLGETTQP